VPPQRPVFAATQRTHTLSFEGSSPAPPVVAPVISRTAPTGSPIVQPPSRPQAPVPTAPAPADSEHTVQTAVPPRPKEGAAAVSANGQFASKLGELGLTKAQVDAVLALSHEVVERVVWEVVPQLAEALIKEEIARLTKD
jgi:hypothetical protein